MAKKQDYIDADTGKYDQDGHYTATVKELAEIVACVISEAVEGEEGDFDDVREDEVATVCQDLNEFVDMFLNKK